MNYLCNALRFNSLIQHFLNVSLDPAVDGHENSVCLTSEGVEIFPCVLIWWNYVPLRRDPPDMLIMSISLFLALFLCFRPSCAVTVRGRGCGPNLNREAESSAERLASSLFVSRVGLIAGIGRVRRRSRSKPSPRHSLHRTRALDSAVWRQSLPCLQRSISARINNTSAEFTPPFWWHTLSSLPTTPPWSQPTAKDRPEHWMSTSHRVHRPSTWSIRKEQHAGAVGHDGGAI